MRKLAFELIVALATASSLMPGTVAAAPVELEVRNVQPLAWFRKNPSEIEIREYSAASPPGLVIADARDVVSCSLDGKPCDAKRPISLELSSVAPRTFSLVTKNKSGETHETKIHLLSAIGSAFKVEGTSELTKDFVLSPTKYLLVLSSAGKLRYYLQPDIAISDFKPHELPGKKRFYSYLRLEKTNTHVNGAGHRVLLDEKFRPVLTFKEVMDGHEFLLLSRKHYLFSEYTKHIDDKNQCLIEAAVRESRSGKISTAFSMVEFMKIYDVKPGHALIFEGRDCKQTGHLNTVQIVDRDRMLLGLGETVVMWNRKMKKAEWIFGKSALGEFEVPNEHGFDLIHSPTWIADSGRLVLFDNGLFKPPVPLPKATARILEFRLDTFKKKIFSTKVFDLAPGSSEFGGGLAVDGDIVSVAFGRHEGRWDVQEIKNGKPTMSIAFGPSKEFYNYRVYRSQPTPTR